MELMVLLWIYQDDEAHDVWMDRTSRCTDQYCNERWMDWHHIDWYEHDSAGWAGLVILIELYRSTVGWIGSDSSDDVSS